MPQKRKPWKRNRFAELPISELLTIYQITKRKRLTVFLSKGITCRHCDLKATKIIFWSDFRDSPGIHIDLVAEVPTGGERILTIDHVIPKSKGGRNEMANYQILCSRCNQKKADELPWWVTQEKVEELLAERQAAQEAQKAVKARREAKKAASRRATVQEMIDGRFRGPYGCS